jgi:hypothetical protein
LWRQPNRPFGRTTEQPPKSGKWKALYKGKWYPVEDVQDMGGKPNLYRLKGIDKLVPVENLDIAASIKPDWLTTAEEIARNAGFDKPENAYWECHNFCLAIVEAFPDINLDLYSARIIAEQDLDEVEAGKPYDHTFIVEGGKTYDFTIRQFKPDTSFPYYSTLSDPIYQGAKKISPSGWDDGPEFWYKKMKEHKVLTYTQVRQSIVASVRAALIQAETGGMIPGTGGAAPIEPAIVDKPTDAGFTDQVLLQIEPYRAAALAVGDFEQFQKLLEEVTNALNLPLSDTTRLASVLNSYRVKEGLEPL